MTPDDPRHGTRAGCIAHRKDGERPCDPCRIADNAYMRAFRSDPKVKATEYRRNAARERVLWRLAALHRDEFQRLYLIELGPPQMEDTA
jgi:hypothetical protein